MEKTFEVIKKPHCNSTACLLACTSHTTPSNVMLGGASINLYLTDLRIELIFLGLTGTNIYKYYIDHMLLMLEEHPDFHRK